MVPASDWSVDTKRRLRVRQIGLGGRSGAANDVELKSTY